MGRMTEDVDAWDRSTYAEIDRATGRTLRALTVLEQHVLMALHCGLYGMDREVIEIITRGIPASAALDKICDISASTIVRAHDGELSRNAKELRKLVQPILERRNQLTHYWVNVEGDDASTFVARSRGFQLAGEVTVADLENLRLRAQDAYDSIMAVGYRLCSAIIAAGPPEAQPPKMRRVYAFDRGRSAPSTTSTESASNGPA